MATIMFELIDDSGVDYAFLSGFGYKESWKGKVCSGHRNDNGTITWQQPCGYGTYTADESHFKEIKASPPRKFKRGEALPQKITKITTL